MVGCDDVGGGGLGGDIEEITFAFQHIPTIVDCFLFLGRCGAQGVGKGQPSAQEFPNRSVHAEGINRSHQAAIGKKGSLLLDDLGECSSIISSDVLIA